MTLPHIHQISFSTNLIIFAVIGLVVVYALMAGHAKIRNLALSVYVGIVLASEFGNSLHKYLSHSHSSGFGVGAIRLVLFIAPIILLEISRRHHARGGHHGMIVSVIMGVLTAGLIIGMGIAQLEPNTIKHITDGSVIAFEIYTYRLWLVAIIPIFIIVEGFIGPGRDEKKH